MPENSLKITSPGRQVTTWPFKVKQYMIRSGLTSDSDTKSPVYSSRGRSLPFSAPCLPLPPPPFRATAAVPEYFYTPAKICRSVHPPPPPRRREGRQTRCRSEVDGIVTTHAPESRPWLGGVSLGSAVCSSRDRVAPTWPRRRAEGGREGRAGRYTRTRPARPVVTRCNQVSRFIMWG